MAADVDAIQKLTNILVLDEARLADESSRLRGIVNVSASDDDLILLSTFINNNTREHVHCSYNVLTQEVTDLDCLAPINDIRVDGEVGIHKSHAIFELLLHTCEQVVDVTAHSAHGRELLGLAEPHGDLDF